MFRLSLTYPKNYLESDIYNQSTSSVNSSVSHIIYHHRDANRFLIQIWSCYLPIFSTLVFKHVSYEVTVAQPT